MDGTAAGDGQQTFDQDLLNLHRDGHITVPEALHNATNPEQLFAAGYAACFGNAVIHVTRTTHKIADDDVTVVGTVSMAPNADGGFALSVALDVAIAGVDQDTAETIVAQAHKVCPYSNAVRGNIDVELSVRAEA